MKANLLFPVRKVQEKRKININLFIYEIIFIYGKREFINESLKRKKSQGTKTLKGKKSQRTKNKKIEKRISINKRRKWFTFRGIRTRRKKTKQKLKLVFKKALLKVFINS